jgi:uncharacterized membrane-anchored protein YitT (DUF2179 family)
MFQNNERNVIYTNVSRREYQILKDFIREIDPRAFITVVDAYEVLGEGFKSFHDH